MGECISLRRMEMKHKISIVIPTYNEKENIMDGYIRVKSIMESKLKKYLYEILFIDNCSNDGTRELLRVLASKDENVKVILNGNNFGWMRSSFYGIINTTGDCVVLLAADMQEPPEKIVDFVREWETGYKIVIGIKNQSKENHIKYFLRSCYYKFINSIAEINHINQFMGFGLYDKDFIDILKTLDDPIPYFRGIVAELGYKIKKIHYTQEDRKRGKTHFNFFQVYDLAMLGITSYSKVLMRLATLLGFFISGGAIFIAIITLILKIFHIINYPTGIAAISIGVFALSGVNIFFTGLVGEYCLSINSRIMKRPLVVEEERINFIEVSNKI